MGRQTRARPEVRLWVLARVLYGEPLGRSGLDLVGVGRDESDRGQRHGPPHLLQSQSGGKLDGILSSTNEIILKCGSQAIDAGVDEGVAVDIHGEAGPEGAGVDIGADEYLSGALDRAIYLPLVLR